MNMVVVWFAIFVALLVFEVMTMGLVCVFFSFGALGASLLALVGVGVPVQLLCFAVLSVASLLLLRRHAQSIFAGRSGKGAESAMPVLNAQGTVVKATAPHVPGEVSVGGSFWRAVSQEPLAEGTPVRVVGVDDNNALLLHVERISTP